MHLYRHAHTRTYTHINIHTVYGPSMWQKDSDLLLDLERLSTFYWQGNPVLMDRNWRIYIFVVLVCGVLHLVSLGIFDIAALKPNWAELSGTTWREDDGELNWTGLKWRPLIPVIPFVWILGILICLCTVWILSDQKWNTDRRSGSESNQHFLAVSQI